MIIAQLLASPFYGGPERQVLGLSKALREIGIDTVMLSYAEGGKADDFLARSSAAGFETIKLDQNWPKVIRCRNELKQRFADHQIDVVCTNGYKPDILGVIAARASKLPSVSIAHGWTSATAKVRVNEWLDKRSMRWFDRVVGVSEEQSRRCVRSGVSPEKVVTIHNGVDPSELGNPNEADRKRLESFFETAPEMIFVAAGRFSPEKGFDVLVDAVSRVPNLRGRVGVVIFGGGPLEEDVRSQIESLDIGQMVRLGGFRNDLDRLLPQADGFILSSRTEGLPVILLEAMAAGVPSIVTPVGGVGELVRDGIEGDHVGVDDAQAIADVLKRWIDSPNKVTDRATASKSRIQEGFTHRQQAEKYAQVFSELVKHQGHRK